MKYKLLIALILLISFIVRFFGIKFNLPYIEFTDELNVIRDALYIAKNLDFSNFHFLYPPLHAYIQTFFLIFYTKFFTHGLDLVSRAEILLLMRGVVAFLGGLSVYFLYKIVEKITKDKVAAIFSMLFFAFNFTHIAYSELVKNEIPMLFFGLISFLMSVNIFKTGKLKFYFWGCFFVALSFATAYLGVIFIIPIIASHLLYNHEKKIPFFKSLFSSKLIFSVVGLLIGVLVGNPIIFTNRELFFDKLNASKGLLSYYQKPLSMPAWKWYFYYSFAYGLYYPVFLLSIGGMIILFKKNLNLFLILFSFILPYGIVIFLRNNYYTDRLFLPMIPFLIIFAGYCLSFFYKKAMDYFNSKKPVKILINLFVFLFFLVLFFRVGIVSYQKILPTPLQQTEIWLDHNIPKNSSILLTATGAELAFSPNEMEKKYNFLYYYPELIKRSVGSLSLSYDYLILYWPGNLPVDWVEDIKKEYKFLADFKPYSFPNIRFLSIYAEIGNPFLVARALNNFGATVFELPKIPEDNYIIFKEINNLNDIIQGKFSFIKGSKGKNTKVIYSTNFSLTSETGSQNYKEFFKPSLEEINFIFKLSKDNFSLSLDKNQPFLGFNNFLKDELISVFNLKNEIKGNFLRPDGNDFCSLGGYCQPSGFEDMHFQISGLEKEFKRIVLRIDEQKWMAPFNGAYPDIYLIKNNGLLDLYIEPLYKIDENSDMEVIIYYEDGTYSLTSINTKI